MKFLVAIALLVALVSATNHLVCPSTQVVKPLYDLQGSDCGRVDFCNTAFCKCIGGEYDNKTQSCPAMATLDDCFRLDSCSRTNIRCLNEEAQIAFEQGECRDWAQPVYMGIVDATLSTEYTNSSLYGACKYQTCAWANQTRRCTPNYNQVCVAPPKYFGTLRLSGDWSDVIATPAKVAALKQSLKTDLTIQLDQEVSVFDVRLGSLIVDFNMLDMDNNTE
eukprot:129961_1